MLKFLFKPFSIWSLTYILRCKRSIKYDTTQDGSAAQFLDPEQTIGKVYPFMFTQCESILCRELLPTQDTPAIKITVSVGITVVKPLFTVERVFIKIK